MEPTTKSPALLRPGLTLAGLTALTMVPVTLPVPVLRGLVQDRFDVSDLMTSLFMSVNMIGAVLAAPVAGAVADKFGRRRQWIAAALLVDGICLLGLTLKVSFPAFLAIRFVEGCAHITALSLLLSMAADLAHAGGRGRVMGMVGAGITLGVAVGAPIGGALGREDPLTPMRLGAVLVAALSVLVVFALPRLPARAGHRPGLREVIRLCKNNRALLAPFGYAFTDRFTVGFFTTTFPLYLKKIHDLPPERIGLLLGLFLGPFFLLSYPFGRLSERVSRTRMLTGGSFLYGVAVMTVGAWDPRHLPYLMVALGTLSAVMFVPSLILTSQLAAPSARSTVLGGFNAAGSLGFILGPIAGGMVSQYISVKSGWRAGYSSAFVVAGCSEVLCVVATIPLLRRLVRSGQTT